MPRWGISIVVAIGACAGPSQSGPTVPPVESEAEATADAAPQRAAPLIVVDGEVSAPDWLEAPVADGVDDPLLGAMAVELGVHTQLARTQTGEWFGASEKLGVSGAFALP